MRSGDDCQVFVGGRLADYDYKVGILQIRQQTGTIVGTVCGAHIETWKGGGAWDEGRVDNERAHCGQWRARHDALADW